MNDTTVNYRIAKCVALRVCQCGFGRTIGQITANMEAARRLGVTEMTQITAIAFFRAQKEKKHFLQVLQQEMYATTIYRSEALIDDIENIQYIDIEDLKESKRVRQIKNLYYALGTELFHKYVLPDLPFSTVQKWLWGAFGNRQKGNTRISRSERSLIKKLLKEGARIRLSVTTSSVYIKHNEMTIRISDHETTEVNFDKKIIIN